MNDHAASGGSAAAWPTSTIDETAASRPASAETRADAEGFAARLRSAVAERLDEATLHRAHRRLQGKAVAIGAWYLASYVFVVLASSWPAGVLACTSLALSMAAVGFNIQHDANHNALFQPRGTRRLTPANRVAGWSMYALGGSARRWIADHVHQHHSATNVVGRDDDIELAPFARLAPHQPHRPWHRFQHLYLWGLYCFTALAMILGDVVGTVVDVVRRRPDAERAPAGEVAQLLATKVAFGVAVVGVPLLLHPWWIVLLGVAGTAALTGLLLGVVFQLAHAVEAADFRHVDEAPSHRWHEWQVRATADFCPGRGPVARLVTWYTGGLNYQTEHHLFPQVPHTAYPLIAPVVSRVCADHGVTHTVRPTLRAALGSHYRHLRAMGRHPEGR